MPRPRSPRRYPRAARLNELVREIVADEVERIDDPRLELVTVTHVAVDPDLRRACVTFSRLGGGEEEAAEVEAGEALVESRGRLQRAIAAQARLKRTPELRFEPDQVLRYAERIETLLRERPPAPTEE